MFGSSAIAPPSPSPDFSSLPSVPFAFRSPLTPASHLPRHWECPTASNAFRITFFARPHHLIPIESYSCKKQGRGWRAIVNFFVAQTSVCALLRQSALEMSAANDPLESTNFAVGQIISHGSPFTASAPFLPRVTSHQSKTTKSCRIRTYAKRTRNSCRIRTSKTQDLKPFRMNTYRKTGEGERVSIPRWIATYQARFRICVRGV
jgi:hypothetical protein